MKLLSRIVHSKTYKVLWFTGLLLLLLPLLYGITGIIQIIVLMIIAVLAEIRYHFFERLIKKDSAVSLIVSVLFSMLILPVKHLYPHYAVSENLSESWIRGGYLIIETAALILVIHPVFNYLFDLIFVVSSIIACKITKLSLIYSTKSNLLCKNIAFLKKFLSLSAASRHMKNAPIQADGGENRDINFGIGSAHLFAWDSAREMCCRDFLGACPRRGSGGSRRSCSNRRRAVRSSRRCRSCTQTRRAAPRSSPSAVRLRRGCGKTVRRAPLRFHRSANWPGRTPHARSASRS